MQISSKDGIFFMAQCMHLTRTILDTQPVNVMITIMIMIIIIMMIIIK